jgi:hypothetical protein
VEALAESAFVLFNVCEGILWIGIAVGFAVVYHRKRENLDLMLASGLLFLAFGVSDFVEIQTGGWYKPWWLLCWKGGTLLSFVVVYVLFRRRRSTLPVDDPRREHVGTEDDAPGGLGAREAEH